MQAIQPDDPHVLAQRLIKECPSTVLMTSEARDLLVVQTISGRILMSASRLASGWHVLIRTGILKNEQN